MDPVMLRCRLLESSFALFRCGAAFAVAFLSVTVVAAQEGAPAFPPAKVEIAIAEQRDMTPTVEFPGTVVSLNDSRIAAEVAGVLVSLAEVGDAVEQGDVLARIDPRLMKVAVRRALANVARLESDLEYRQRQLERTENLAANNNASATLLDESRALRDQVRHQLADARAQVEQAEGDLERAEIRAAFAGHVTERVASVGEYIDVGEDVLRLVDTHRIEVSVAAPIALTRFIKAGQSVRVRSGPAEREHPVRTVVPVGDAVSRMVEIRLNAGSGDWLVGAPVQVSLPSGAATRSVAVPRDALVERAGQTLLYKFSPDGTALKIVAEIESTVGLWVAIADGVQAGDQVIVRGAERLTDGQPVEVVPRSR
jgi:RND family efflux transporter MFP subunit